MISQGEILSDFGYSVALVESLAAFLLSNQRLLWAASVFTYNSEEWREREQRSEVVVFSFCSWQKIQPCVKVHSCRSQWAVFRSAGDLIWFMAWVVTTVQLRWTGMMSSHFCLPPTTFPLIFFQSSCFHKHASSNQSYSEFHWREELARQCTGSPRLPWFSFPCKLQQAKS